MVSHLSVSAMPMTVAQYLQKLCSTTFEGGRIVQDDEETIMLYDVPRWPGSRSDALTQKFQNITIDIFQCGISVSGFVVVVTVASMSTTVSSRLIAVVMLLFIIASCSLCWQCLTYTLENVHELNLFQISEDGQQSTCHRPMPPSSRPPQDRPPTSDLFM